MPHDAVGSNSPFILAQLYFACAPGECNWLNGRSRRRSALAGAAAGVSLSYASGDRRRDDNALNTFDPHYPIIAVLTEAPIYFPANLSHAGLNLTLTPSSVLSVRIEALHFARSSDADAIYSSIGGVLAAAPEGALASSNALVANAAWAPSRYFDAQLQLVYASPLGGLDRAGAVDLTYGLFQMSVHF